MTSRGMVKRFGLSMVAALAVTACSMGERRANDGTPASPTGPSSPVLGSVKVDRVRVYIKDDQPQAFVQGELGDGCTSVDSIVQTRHDQLVDIAVTFRRVGEVCTLILQSLDVWVPLRSVFEPGEYTVRSNGIDIRVRFVRGANGALRVDPDPGALPQPPYRP